MARIKPVKNYDPKMLELMQSALAGKKVLITCDDFDRAQALRMQFYNLRYAMKKEKHPLAESVTELSFPINLSTLEIVRKEPDIIPELRQAQ